jgi:hypothetical protein
MTEPKRSRLKAVFLRWLIVPDYYRTHLPGSEADPRGAGRAHGVFSGLFFVDDDGSLVEKGIFLKTKQKMLSANK